MREYSKVSPQFWIGATGKKLRKAGPEAQVVAMYLMTSPHANMLGLYYLPLMYIAHETGLGMEGASKGLQRAVEVGFCSFDEDSEVVWVHEMASYQIADELKPADKRCVGVQNEYDAVPANPFLAAFYDRYQAAFCMTRKRGYSPEIASPMEAPPKPLASQEQEQEQEQEHISAPARAVSVAEHDPIRKDFETSFTPKPKQPKPQKPVSADDEGLQEACRVTWAAYCDAYFGRYGTEPVRNAKVNANVKAFVKSLGAKEAPLVAAWYVANNEKWYVSQFHDFSYLLKDCGKLRTQWATNGAVSGKQRDSNVEALRLLGMTA